VTVGLLMATPEPVPHRYALGMLAPWRSLRDHKTLPMKTTMVFSRGPPRACLPTRVFILGGSALPLSVKLCMGFRSKAPVGVSKAKWLLRKMVKAEGGWRVKIIR
jgi:hypothetical protein